MMTGNKKLLLIMLLVFPVMTVAQARPASCQVRPLWVGLGVRSANLGALSQFQVNGQERRTIRSFPYKDTGLVVTVGIDYEFDYSKSKPKPFAIRLAITVSDKEEKEIFESVESAEASTSYAKKWNLSVTKNIPFDERVFMFTLSCHDNDKRNSQALSK